MQSAIAALCTGCSLGYTASLAALTGRARTILRAGFALNVVGLPVKGLMPLRALVAGFLRRRGRGLRLRQ